MNDMPKDDEWNVVYLGQLKRIDLHLQLLLQSMKDDN